MEAVDQLNHYRFLGTFKFKLQRRMRTLYPQIMNVGRIFCKVVHITLWKGIRFFND